MRRSCWIKFSIRSLPLCKLVKTVVQVWPWAWEPLAKLKRFIEVQSEPGRVRTLCSACRCGELNQRSVLLLFALKTSPVVTRFWLLKTRKKCERSLSWFLRGQGSRCCEQTRVKPASISMIELLEEIDLALLYAIISSMFGRNIMKELGACGYIRHFFLYATILTQRFTLVFPWRNTSR